MTNKHFRPILFSTVLCALLLAGVAFWYVSVTGKAPDAFYTVTNGSISEEVKSSGTVKAAKSVDLSFEKSGRIVYVGADIGDEIAAGKVLASLDVSDVVAQQDQANANVTAQQAKLDQLQHGARPEQIAIQQTNIVTAEASLTLAQKAAVAQINNAYVAGDGAIHSTADALFNNPRSANPTLLIVVTDSAMKSTLDSSRQALENTFVSWNASLVSLGNENVPGAALDLSGYIAEAESNLTSVQDFLAKLAIAVNSSISDQRLIDGYKTSIGASRASVSAAITALVSSESAYKSAQSALNLAQNQMTLLQNGGTNDDIRAQQAQVDQAKASVAVLQAQLAKANIRAPFVGKVIRQDAKVGQISTPNVPVISLISDANFQIETYVPEIDIGKIKLTDSASVTLDAYGNAATFGASVIKIDPAETVRNGVSTYKVTLEFAQNDDRIRSGMTANVDIHSSDKSDAVVIPKQSVITENNQSYVLFAGKSGTPVLQKIETGKESADGMVEVISGLKVGDKIESFGTK